MGYYLNQKELRALPEDKTIKEINADIKALRIRQKEAIQKERAAYKAGQDIVKG